MLITIFAPSNVHLLEVAGVRDKPSLDQRRALGIAVLLRTQGIEPVSGPASGATFTLSEAPAP